MNHTNFILICAFLTYTYFFINVNYETYFFLFIDLLWHTDSRCTANFYRQRHFFAA